MQGDPDGRVAIGVMAKAILSRDLQLPPRRFSLQCKFQHPIFVPYEDLGYAAEGSR
jgi:hypothetical protein